MTKDLVGLGGNFGTKRKRAVYTYPFAAYDATLLATELDLASIDTNGTIDISSGSLRLLTGASNLDEAGIITYGNGFYRAYRPYAEITVQLASVSGARFEFGFGSAQSSTPANRSLLIFDDDLGGTWRWNVDNGSTDSNADAGGTTVVVDTDYNLRVMVDTDGRTYVWVNGELTVVNTPLQGSGAFYVYAAMIAETTAAKTALIKFLEIGQEKR